MSTFVAINSEKDFPKPERKQPVHSASQSMEKRYVRVKNAFEVI
jgi:hypothetical protein